MMNGWMWRALQPTILSVAILAAVLQPAAAQTYPTHAVRLVVPFAAGGPTDTLARILADKLSVAWGEPVVIENRAGGGANIGTELVARAAPDGYTLLLNASNHVINAGLYDKLPYDPIRDFTPITEVASYMLVLVVHPSVPVTTLSEFVALARANPGSIAVGNAGMGTPTHLSALMFAKAAGLDVLQVPYKGAAPANTDLLGGQVSAMFNNPVNALPQVRSGALRGLAVTGSKRLALVPDLPTVAESGYPGFEASTWYGLYAPAGLPREIVDKVNADVVKALNMPDVQEKLRSQGWNVIGSPSDEFAGFLRSELDKWIKLIRDAGLKVD